MADVDVKDIFTHVCLPPNLPGQPEDNLVSIENALTERVLSVIKEIAAEFTHFDGWRQIEASLQASQRVCPVADAAIERSSLKKELAELPKRQCLILYVVEQNAGLLIYRPGGSKGPDTVIFESFEASALSQSVLAAQNGLSWHFPGTSAALPYQTFADPKFLDVLATFCEQANEEKIERFSNVVRKAGQTLPEVRNTSSPALITHYLMTLIAALGEQRKFTSTLKHVHDDSVWCPSETSRPWRRSSWWLVLRVYLQRHLTFLHGAETGRFLYKFVMCVFLRNFLVEEVSGNLHPESVKLLVSKLARRLAKVEDLRHRASGRTRALIDSLIAAWQVSFSTALVDANEKIGLVWMNIRRRSLRQIPHLPPSASDSDLRLTLPNSSPYLQHALSNPLTANPIKRPRAGALYENVAEVANFFKGQEEMLYREMKLRIFSSQRTPKTDCQAAVSDIASQLDEYIKHVVKNGIPDPEYMGERLLHVMEAWAALDKICIRAYPFLGDFQLPFASDLLNILQLPKVNQMTRLVELQTYLKLRNDQARTKMTIFSPPSQGCFAERFYDEAPESIALKKLKERLEARASQARSQKEDEWNEKRKEYDDATKIIESSVCASKFDFVGPQRTRVEVHDMNSCAKCYHTRRRKRLKIQRLEHPLPDWGKSRAQAKAILFELQCPWIFTRYRDLTWTIIHELGLAVAPDSRLPKLAAPMRDRAMFKHLPPGFTSRVTLVSTTKSFTETHYTSKISFPQPVLGALFLRHGCDYSYADSTSRVWADETIREVTFHHHFHLSIPETSPYHVLVDRRELVAGSGGFTSNAALAGQVECPSGVNLHEWMAFMSLCADSSLRWPKILIELASSNINLGSKPIASLLARLTMEVGPPSGTNPLRENHVIFDDAVFCERLAERINAGLDSVASNWRESTVMSVLVALALRLFNLNGRSDVRLLSSTLLRHAREICRRWVKSIRKEISASTDAQTCKILSTYLFQAALILRSTFGMFLHAAHPMEEQDIQTWVEGSLAFQESLTKDPKSLSNTTRMQLARDVMASQDLGEKIRIAAKALPAAILRAIQETWDGILPSDEVDRHHMRTVPYAWWITIIVRGNTEFAGRQVDLHILEGRFLLDGERIGALPEDQRSEILQELYGDQNLFAVRSNLPGCSLMIQPPIQNHILHIGYRKGKQVIRAFDRNLRLLLEYVPRSIFVSPTSWDLPSALIEDCFHWMECESGIIHIREKGDIWITRPRNWHLHFHDRFANRRQVRLIDPNSTLFSKVSQVFHGFESPEQLTAFQPIGKQGSKLKVELKRMKLSFTRQRSGNLFCFELNAEIDENQDAGIWYGLSSKIVMKARANPGKRSILIPLGEISYRRVGPHVDVHMSNLGHYGYFSINNVLGRLDCPVEPILLYTQALLFACTSFVLPDELTGRTGTEEALALLSSGKCQPWRPLAVGPKNVLSQLASLSPAREYYPKGHKTMQTVKFDENLTFAAQHDAFRLIVDAIHRHEDRLALFHTTTPPKSKKDDSADDKLSRKAIAMHMRYSRQEDGLQSFSAPPKSTEYSSRDRAKLVQERRNVHEVVSILQNEPAKFDLCHDILREAETWSSTCGYNEPLKLYSLYEHLSLDLGASWGPLVRLCMSSDAGDTFKLMLCLSLVSFSSDIRMDLLRTLLAFFLFKDLRQISPPTCEWFVSHKHVEMSTEDYLKGVLVTCKVSWEDITKSLSEVRPPASDFPTRETWDQEFERDLAHSVSALLIQWPSKKLDLTLLNERRTLNKVSLFEDLLPKWAGLFDNYLHSQYLETLEPLLRSHYEPADSRPQAGVAWEFQKAPVHESSRPIVPSMKDLVAPRAHSLHASAAEVDKGQRHDIELRSNGVKPSTFEFTHLETLSQGTLLGTERKSIIRERYANDLMSSVRSLQSRPRGSGEMAVHASTKDSDDEHVANASLKMHDAIQRVRAALSRSSLGADWLQQGHLWPTMTAVSIVGFLVTAPTVVFGVGMKELFVEYALSITALQRALRIQDARLRQLHSRLNEELQQQGYENWSPLENPTWLAIEIEANILIRKEQVDVARATMLPDTKSNSVVQLQMGRGKTSCIIPMAASLLADTKQLVRVIVPKALLHQVAQVLQGRIGGLLDRRLFHIPFSRRTSTSPSVVREYFNLHRELMASSGILLCLPENIMSFQLSGLQQLSDGCLEDAKPMIQAQRWLRSHCRDILDESDQILSVRTQLIYPGGNQTAVDGHPSRWEVVQNVLHLVRAHLPVIKNKFPRSIECLQRPGGGFPITYFLRQDAENALITRLVHDVLHGGIKLIPTEQCTLREIDALEEFISCSEVSVGSLAVQKSMFSDNPAAQHAMLLIRGLLVDGILLLCLKKRFNVQYGLHPDRDPVAVPFTAKGVASPTSEWGHIDVSILLTVLSFYFRGLNEAQMRDNLQHIMRSDDPSGQYEKWSQSVPNMPESLRKWSSVNTDDELQLQELLRYLRYSTVAIDDFLNSLVFPRHARQFTSKLQASGWDLLLPTPALTTGFSGTNDNRYVLPLNVEQNDLENLAHTNAEVLGYLLEERNRDCIVAADNGRRLSEKQLLSRLHDSGGIRVLIDAGAQIFELTNRDVAREWLKIDPRAAGAAYFKEDDSIWVLYRNSDKEAPLAATPFAEDMHECLLYLDQAHTRGVDIKLPPFARAAVTVSLGQTKDDTVQAAMRMRQLATTQSVLWVIPIEVDQSLRDYRMKPASSPIDSQDVIAWLLEQSCQYLESMQPLYYAQGSDHLRRAQAVLDNPEYLTNVAQRNRLLNTLRQPEKQTLEDTYGPQEGTELTSLPVLRLPAFTGWCNELEKRKRDFLAGNSRAPIAALSEVEQEREVQQEAESVREVQRKMHYKPRQVATTLLHEIVSLLKNGKLPFFKEGVEPAFNFIKRTGHGSAYQINTDAISGSLYVTRHFTTTVDARKARDNFLRPVNWILLSHDSTTALLLSPEEAELVLKWQRAEADSKAYLLTYAAPCTRTMMCLNDFKYLPISSMPDDWSPPHWLRIEVGIFAGRLYFGFEEYKALCELLGVECYSESTQDNHSTAELASVSDKVSPYDQSFPPLSHSAGNIPAKEAQSPHTAAQLAVNASNHARLVMKPLSFLQGWLDIRRKGSDFAYTPMGFLAQGKPLMADHPFFTKHQMVIDSVPAVETADVKENDTGNGIEEEEDIDHSDDDEQVVTEMLGELSLNSSS